MELDTRDLEKVLLCDIARDLLKKLPDEKKQEILEAALTKFMASVASSWQIQESVKPLVQEYMKEYLEDPEVQHRIWCATQKAVDELMSGVVNVIIHDAQNGIKSDYRKFIEKKDIKS